MIDQPGELNRLFKLFCTKQMENLFTYVLRDWYNWVFDFIPLYFYLNESLDQHSFNEQRFEAYFRFTQTNLSTHSLHL